MPARIAGDAAEVVAAIQKDPYAMGFCKLINVLDFENQGIVENIRLAADRQEWQWVD